MTGLEHTQFKTLGLCPTFNLMMNFSSGLPPILGVADKRYQHLPFKVSISFLASIYLYFYMFRLRGSSLLFQKQTTISRKLSTILSQLSTGSPTRSDPDLPLPSNLPSVALELEPRSELMMDTSMEESVCLMSECQAFSHR